MSRTAPPPARSQPEPLPPGATVAVLVKRGRFVVAEPLFARRDDGSGSGREHHGTSRIAVDPNPSHGGRRAVDGDLVVVQAPRRGAAGGRSAARGKGNGARGAGTRGRVLRVLGRPDVARDVIEGLMIDRGLKRAFHPAVLREASAARDRGREPASAGGRAARRDLRDLPTFTIDPVSARDFDDAISALALEGGGVRLWVHIADVSAYVPAGSLVDREARRRGTSVYVPGAVEPMLPEALSNEACSLVPGHDRLAVTVEFDLQGADVVRTAFYRSLIRSDERLDYDRVDRIFAGSEQAHDPWATPLAAARQAARALDDARLRRRSALSLDSPEPEFSFDERGHISDVRGRVQTESHRLIEHLMITANEAVARLLAERSVPTLYRVHERPEPERVRRLVDQLATLGVSTPPLPDLLAPSQASALLGDISRRVQEHIERTGRGRIALTTLVLRSLKQASYSPVNIGHAGLGSSCYCHFTSPIRRYPDLVCHRGLLSAVGGGEHAPAATELAELGALTSEREREAMIIERDADDIARCFALERLLYDQGWGSVFSGEVTGLIGAGAFMAFAVGELQKQAEVPPFEGMLPVRRMQAIAGDGSGERDWWELNEQGTILLGTRTHSTLRLGDAMDVRVRRVEALRGRVDLDPVAPA